MSRMMVVVIISVLMVIACSQLPAEMPQDISLTLEWNTGSLPPQYTYRYVISLGPGLQDKFEYRPGYDPNDTSRQWVTTFSISEKQKEELFAYLQTQDIFRSKWKNGDLRYGSSGTSLILNAYGKEFHVPSISKVDRTEYAQVDAAIEAIRALVPQTIWEEMKVRQADYEAGFVK